jgi:hypothetical protein
VVLLWMSLCNFRANCRPGAPIIRFMNTHSTPGDGDSDFGPTVPGQRSGEGSGSILPYLANSLKVNPNAGALSLARELRAGSQRKKKNQVEPEPIEPTPPVKAVKLGPGKLIR